MSKFQDYYRSIRQRQTELAGKFPDGCCLVIAGGTVAEVPVPLAAKLLTEETHALASDDQARAFRETQTAARARSAPATTLDEIRAQFSAVMRERGTHVAQ